MVSKNDILKDIMTQFKVDGLEVPLKIAIENAFQAGLDEGNKTNEAEEWKKIATKMTKQSEERLREVDRLKKDGEKIKTAFELFSKEITRTRFI